MKKDIILRFTLFKFLEGLTMSFVLGTSQLFLQERGLNLLEINLLNLIYMSSIFILEIPTGALADRFGRKKLVMIGLLIKSIGFSIYYCSNTFPFFMTAEVVIAMGFACISGALEGLIVNLMKTKDSYPLIFKRAETSQLGIALGVVVGAYLGQTNLATPWLMTAIFSFILSLVFIILFSKYKEDRVVIERVNMFKLASKGVKLGMKSKGIMSISLLAAALALTIQALNMYWSIFLKEEHFLEIKYMGYVFLAIVSFNYLGTQLANRWQKKLKNPAKSIILSLFLTSLSILLCCLFSGLNSFLLFFLLHEIGRGIFKPLSRTYLNNLIDDKYRSTILSLESMIVKIGAGLGLLLSGLLANSYGIVISWLLSAIVLIIVVLYYLITNPLQKGVFYCYNIKVI